MNAVEYSINHLTQARYALQAGDLRSFWLLPVDEACRIMDDDGELKAKTQEAFARLEGTEEGRQKIAAFLEKTRAVINEVDQKVAKTDAYKEAVEFLKGLETKQ